MHMVDVDPTLEWHRHQWVIQKRYRFLCFVRWVTVSEPMHWKQCLYHLKHLTEQEVFNRKKYHFVFRPKRNKN